MGQLHWAYDDSAHTITKNGLCLSSGGRDLPLTLEQCGNTSVYQNFTYDSKTQFFHIPVKAGNVMEVDCLQMATCTAACKTDVYKCEAKPQQQWTINTNEGTLSTSL